MHLCHINLSKELRGGEVQTIALVECLAERFEQSVIVRRGGLLHERLERNGRNGVHIVPVSNSLPAAMRAIRGVDLLHVHEGRSVQVGALCSVFGPPFVVTRRMPTRPKDNFFAHWCYSRASVVVGVSETVSSVMRSYIPEDNVTTIPDYVPPLRVDADTSEALRERYRDKIVIGHVGALHDWHKGQLVILAAARKAQNSYPDLHFILVGGGRDEKMLRENARGLDNVEFIGRVDNVGDYYSVMDLFVFPSREEALGSAILEAMSFGLPIIGSKVGGIPEVVRPGENGTLIPNGDADALYEAVLKLAHDPDLRERLGAGARKLAEERRVDVAAEDYIAVYERLLGGRRLDGTNGHEA